jgi:hypothetical protein
MLMSECPWNDLDEAVRTYLLSALRDYDYLPVQRVEKIILRAAADWEAWSRGCDSPAVAVLSHTINLTPGPHGNPEKLLNDVVFPYSAIPVVKGTRLQAHEDAKLLLWRTLQALKVQKAFVVTIDGNQKAFRVQLQGADVWPWPLRGSQADTWFAAAPVDFRLTTSSI